MKVNLGLWLMPEDKDSTNREGNIKQALAAVELANAYPDVVMSLSIGNETQVFWSGHRMSPENLIRYIRAIRKNVSVPVTTADDYLYWIEPESETIGAEVDFIFSHMHPLWNGQTLDNAFTWIDSIYAEVQQCHPDRPVIIGETGWATDYNADKNNPGEQGALIKGEVSVEAQGEFLRQYKKWLNKRKITSFLFEVFDESWKGGSDKNEVEKHWGVYYEDKTPKKSFERLIGSN